MAAAELSREMDKLLACLVEEGTLNAQFKCVLSLEDASSPNFASEVVHLFLSETRTRLARVRSCLTEGPAIAEAQRLVMLMKGSNLTFGAQRLTTLCEQVRKELETRDTDSALRTLDMQEACLEHLSKQLDVFLGLDTARKQTPPLRTSPARDPVE